MKLVLATKNKNKVIEIQNKFSNITGLELIPLSIYEQPPEVEEDGATFEENALKKGRKISDYTKLSVLSDDSGLVVDALNGRPGIYSARYIGKNATDYDRNCQILKEMEGFKNNREARFICAIAIVFPDGKSYTTHGECKGTIGNSIKGANGFGYDPIFHLPDFGKTMAELTLEEKNKISHRAKALEKARELLFKLLSGNLNLES